MMVVPHSHFRPHCLRQVVKRALQALYSNLSDRGFEPQTQNGGGIEMGVVFQEYDGAMVGIGEHGRRWRVIETRTGWRLEFRDAGDAEATYAGTHRSLESAMAEASR